MGTPSIQYIQSSGGDATSLNAAALLVSTATNTDWILRYNEAMEDNTGCTINRTLGAGSTLTIDVADAYKHRGRFGVGARLVYNSGSADQAILVGGQPFTMKDLEIRYTGSATGNGYTLANSGPQNTKHFHRLLMKADTNGAGTARVGIGAAGVWNFYNCALITDMSAHSSKDCNGFQMFSGTINCYSCTSIIQLATSRTGHAFVSCNVANCIAGRGGAPAGSAYSSCAAIGDGYNLSTDNTAVGTYNYQNVTLSDILRNMTAGSEDIRLKDRNPGTNYSGADLSGTIGDGMGIEAFDGFERTDHLIGCSYPPNSPVITTTTLPSGETGVEYTETIEGDYDIETEFTLQSGTLPDGLTLETHGTLHGTPTVADTFNFTVRATDAYGQHDDQSFEVEIADGGGGSTSGRTFSRTFGLRVFGAGPGGRAFG